MTKAAIWLFRIILVVLVLAGAGTLIPRPFLSPAKADPAARYSILVLSNPIHTDIALQLDDALRKRFAFLNAAGVPVANPGAAYLIFGWGGRSFYLETPHWSDLKPSPVFKALTMDRSVLHVDVAGRIPPNDPAVIALQIDGSGFERLLGFIEASFLKNNGAPQPVPSAHYGKYDAFFEANGSFNALFGCNTWTAEALRQAGLRTGWWNPLPQSLAWSLELYD
jgi:uncharacterized protein (TIGR02117 family)